MIEQLESTFRDDFTVAERMFGMDWIRKLYKSAFKHWKDDLKYITELVLVLNWKWWYRADRNKMEVSRLYTDLWEETHDWCCSNLKWEDLKYYLRKVD